MGMTKMMSMIKEKKPTKYITTIKNERVHLMNMIPIKPRRKVIEIGVIIAVYHSRRRKVVWVFWGGCLASIINLIKNRGILHLLVLMKEFNRGKYNQEKMKYKNIIINNNNNNNNKSKSNVKIQKVCSAAYKGNYQKRKWK